MSGAIQRVVATMDGAVQRIVATMDGAVRRIVARALTARGLAAVAALLVMPSLAGGLALDDHLHRITVFGHPLFPERSALDVFRFADGDRAHGRALIEVGFMPWFSRADARVAFLRPLASLSHYVDYRALHLPPWVMHAENVAWYALLVFFAAALHRRVIGEGAAGVAGLAGLLYAVDFGHALPAGWVANRNALISAALGVAAVVAYDRARRQAWRTGAFVGPACFACALAGGEAAISVLALLVAHALTLDPAPRRARAIALAPYFGIAALWQVAYRALGYGASGSAFYVDPASSPRAYLEALATRAPVLLAGEITLLPPEVYAAMSRTGTWELAALAIVVCSAFAWAVAPIVRESPAARFYALASFLALPAACTTYPASRLLLFSGVGVAGLLALALGARGDRAERPTLRRALVLGSGAAHLAIAPLLLPAATLSPAIVGRLADGTTRDVPQTSLDGDKTTVVVRAPAYMLAGYAFALARGGEPRLRGPLRVLGCTRAPTDVRRVDARTLEIRAPADLTGDPTARLYRDTPMVAGETMQLSDVRATVLEVDAAGAPRAVSFRFATPLEDPSRSWIVWDGGRFVPFVLPEPGTHLALR